MTLKKHFDETAVEAGCDEAGRGCLAGPVFAAAVILPKKFPRGFLQIDDSKKLDAETRSRFRAMIEKSALAWAVAKSDVEEIDEINIVNASFSAMHKAIAQLQIVPELLLIDGNRFKPFPNIPHRCEVKGDGRFLSIAAASILAKTYRDEYMENLHVQFPQYNWKENKGYATFSHYQSIHEHGLSVHHRRSFNMNKQLKLELD